MNTAKYSLVSILTIILLTQCTNSKNQDIPDTTGRWRVEVSPLGNEFYELPAPLEMQPPSEKSLQTVRDIIPNYIANVSWEQDEGEYLIRGEKGNDEYLFILSSNEQLKEIIYYNNYEDYEEEAGELIIKGTRKKINNDKVPKVTLNLLSSLFPNSQVQNLWIASTPHGNRFVFEIGEMIFYARPDGQICAMKLKKNGALDERERQVKKLSKEELIVEAKKSFNPYLDKFNFEKQINKLSQDNPSKNESYRFIVVGDSRSNPELWQAIINHIDQLEPKPKFVINTGDVVRHGYIEEYLKYYIPPLLKTDIPYFIAIGNHDAGLRDDVIEYRTLFGNNSTNYYFDYGNVRYIIIDNVSNLIPYENTLSWLEGVLENTPEDHKIIVAAHKPVATVKKWEYHSWSIKYSKVFDELMSKYNVEYVFFGHIHAYSTAVKNDILYTIAGGGGASLHDRFGPLGNIHHYVICDVLPDGTINQQVVRFYKKDE